MPYFEVKLVRSIKQWTTLTVEAISEADAMDRASEMEDPHDVNWVTTGYIDSTFPVEAKLKEEEDDG